MDEEFWALTKLVNATKSKTLKKRIIAIVFQVKLQQFLLGVKKWGVF